MSECCVGEGRRAGWKERGRARERGERERGEKREKSEINYDLEVKRVINLLIIIPHLCRPCILGNKHAGFTMILPSLLQLRKLYSLATVMDNFRAGVCHNSLATVHNSDTITYVGR